MSLGVQWEPGLESSNSREMLAEERVVVEGLDYPSEQLFTGPVCQTKPLCQLQCPQIILKRSCQPGLEIKIRRGGLRLYRCPVKPFLSPANREARYRWAQNHVFWQNERFWSVVWSDESQFRLSKNHGRVRVLRQPGERYRDDPIQYSRQAGGGSVHVWDAIWLMADLLSKFFSRMLMAKCTTEFSTTFLVKVPF